MESSRRNFSKATFQIEEERDIFEELFSSQYYDVLIIGLYCLGLLSCIGLILVSWFEKSGQAGPYRSLVNQLISQRLDQMVLLYVFGIGISANRMIYGALPLGICKFCSYFQMFTILNICHLTILISGTRFAFVFIFKQIPAMDDKFLSIFLMILVNVWSFLASMSKFYIDEKALMSARICSGTWPEDTAEETFAIVALACCYTLLIYVGFNLAIKFKKGQLETSTTNHYNNGHVQELFDVVSTFLSTLALVFTVISYTMYSRVTKPEELLEYPNNVLVRISAIPSMFCFVTIQSISHFWKNSHIRKACWRLFHPVKVTPIVQNKEFVL